MMLKHVLINASIGTDWDLPFEIVCDASNYSMQAVLGQRIDMKPTIICHARNTLSKAHKHYTMA